MNQVALIGRLCKDPDYRQTENGTSVARFTLAVDRLGAKEGDQKADFINIVCFGKTAEFADRYLHQGTKIGVYGRIQTGSYTNRDGQKVYTFDVCAAGLDFADAPPQRQEQRQETRYDQREERREEPRQDRREEPQRRYEQRNDYRNDGFLDIPDDIDDMGLPFN